MELQPLQYFTRCAGCRNCHRRNSVRPTVSLLTRIRSPMRPSPPCPAAYFTFPFISHLFSLVERTRDAEDETFNYTLIKLLIALNEQFMVSALPVLPPGSQAQLPPPILPTNAKKEVKETRGPNFVLEVLKEKGDTCKTFGENIIFILNRTG